jgi:hypothetical protein
MFLVWEFQLILVIMSGPHQIFLRGRKGRLKYMQMLKQMKTRWGVGLWGIGAILAAFSLAGLTVVRLKQPIMGYLLPADAPRWLGWTVYVLAILPLHMLCSLIYGSLLGQFRFFWGRIRLTGMRIARIFTSASN